VARHAVDRLDFAAIAVGGADVEQAQRSESGAECLAIDDPGIRPGGREREDLRRRGFGRAGLQRATGRGPGTDPAVEHRDGAMTERVEHPPEATRDARAGVVVDDHGVLVADPGSSQARCELDGVGERMAACALARAQVPVKVDEDGARQPAGLEGRAAPAGLREIPADVDEPRACSRIRFRRGGRAALRA